MASKAIKGITIELDGNTSKFQKSLSDANKSIKETQKELREVNKALKLDPKNTELLKQKQDLLKKSVDDVAKRLEIEKKGLAELQKADQTPEVTAQMRKLERQIATDEATLKSAKKEFKDFGSVGKQQAKVVNEEWEKAGKKIGEVGGKIKSTGETLTKNLTVPIVAAGAASVAAFNEVDEGYDIVIKKTGAAGEAAQEMYDIVDQLATSIPTDFATAGNAVGEVSTRFGVTGDALYELSEQFIKFAELNDTDVTSSVDSVQKALEAFGLSSEDAGSYLDALNKAAQDSGIGIDTLTNLTVQNSVALQDMGLSLKDSTELMAQLEKSSVPVETVMGGLSKALKNATDEGKPLDQALAELQHTIANNEGGTEGLAAAYELFGKQGDKVFKAIQDGTLDFENLAGAAEESAGSVSSTFEETLDPIDQWKMTLNELKLTGAELGATIGEILQPILKEVAQVVSDLRAKWQELSPEQQNMIVQIAGIVAVVGPVVTIIGSIVNGISALITSITVVAGVLGVAASTVGIVIAAITAIIAAIVLLITHWDQVTAAVKGAWEKITEYTTQLKENVTKKFEEIKQQLAQKLDSIKSDMSSKWNQIKSDTIAKVTGMKTDVVNKYEELKSKAAEKINSVKSDMSSKWNQIKSDTITKVTGMKTDVVNKYEEIKKQAAEKINSVKSDMLSKWNQIKSDAVDKVTGMKSDIASKMDDIKSKFREKLDDIKGFFSNLELKIPAPSLPALPHFSLRTSTKSILGQDITYPSGIDVDWYAKAMKQPYMFTNPTVMQTPYGMIGAGEAGNEIMYGQKALMEDITAATAANNELLVNGMYEAMKAALRSADLKVQIGSREFGRVLREAGAL